MPLFVRKFILDFVESALGAFLALNIAFPTTFTQVQQAAAIVGIATFGAFVPAVRRAIPGLLAWLASKLGLPPNS